MIVVVRPAIGLLRRQVVEGGERDGAGLDRAGRPQRLDPEETEVGQLDLRQVRRHANGVRPDVAVNDAVHVGLGKPAADPLHHMDGFGQRQPAAAQHLVERDPVKRLGDQIRPVPLAAGGHDLEEVGMGKAGQGVPFALKALQRSRLLDEPGREEVDPDLLVLRRTDGAVDGRRPLAAERLGDAIGADLGRLVRHRSRRRNGITNRDAVERRQTSLRYTLGK